MIFLARLLPREAYGLMAMATVATNLAYLFRDMGTAAAIIQAKNVSDELLSTVHWTNVGLGVLIGVLIAVAAPLMSLLFNEPGLTNVLLLLALVFPLSSLGVVHQALLERSSRFQLVAKAEVSGALLGLTVALWLGWLGAGVYSLVAQMIITIAVTTFILIRASTLKPLPRWHREEFAAIMGFGGNLSLFNLVNYFARSADSMVVGRLLGATQLGIYSMAYKVMLLPVQNMSWVALRALFPVMSRNQGDVEEMARLYLKTISFIAFLTAPLMTGLFALREPFVLIVFGEKWHEVASVLTWLAPVGFIQSIVSTTGVIFMSTGKTNLMLRLGVLGAVLQVTAFVVGVRWGVEGVAACYLVANVLNALPALYFSGQLIGIDLMAMFRALLPSIGLSLLMGSTVMLFGVFMHGMNAPFVLAFVMSTLLGLVLYSGGSYLFNISQIAQLRSFLHRV